MWHRMYEKYEKYGNAGRSGIAGKTLKAGRIIVYLLILKHCLAMENFNFESVQPQDSPLEFWLVTTDHTTDRIWFKDDQDFKVGMNYIAIIAILSGIDVLAFILMSNHVHLVLQCSNEEAEWFINEFKRRYSEYLSKRYGKSESLREIRNDIRPIYLEDESVERTIAYVLMNSVAANICVSATDYPWGSAGAYFRIAGSRGYKVGDISARKRRTILHSRAELPGNVVIGEGGYILPESFIPVKFVESVFRSPKRLNYFLMNSSKAKRVRESKDSGLLSFRDQVIFGALPDMCRTLFQKKSSSSLSEDEMNRLVTEVRYRFNADVAQIARILGLKYTDVVNILERF